MQTMNTKVLSGTSSGSMSTNDASAAGNENWRMALTQVFDLGNVGWVSLEGAFEGCINLGEVGGGATEHVVSTARMFNNAPKAKPTGIIAIQLLTLIVRPACSITLQKRNQLV
jgi:hypothetical protein